jgi:hypothetical protein
LLSRDDCCDAGEDLDGDFSCSGVCVALIFVVRAGSSLSSPHSFGVCWQLLLLIALLAGAVVIFFRINKLTKLNMRWAQLLDSVPELLADLLLLVDVLLQVQRAH